MKTKIKLCLFVLLLNALLYAAWNMPESWARVIAG